DTLRAHDTVHVQWIRPDGSLINGAYMVTRDGEVEADLTLTPLDDGKWGVKGTFDGEKLDQPIAGDLQPGSMGQLANQPREAFARSDKVGASITMPMWMVADPTSFTDVRTTLGAALDPHRISATEVIGELEAESILDKATGYPISSRLKEGSSLIEL